MSDFKKIAVLMGGTSNEREVSLVSGRNVADALESLGRYEVLRVVLDADDLSALPANVDACYVALHGGWGENGGVQAALDARGIPYTGPGAAASRLAMDKIATKRALDEAGVPTAPWAVVRDPAAECPLPFPCVVKPPMDGSSVGISRVNAAADWPAARELALDTDLGYRRREGLPEEPCVLVEDYIPGRETTVGVLGGDVLPVIEICAPGGWYGYEEKYNSDATRYLFPQDAFIAEMQRLAKRAYDACGCRGVTRVDFRVTPEGRMYVLELNTSPGMTGHSLVPKAAAEIGIPFPALCARILETATHD